MSRPGNDQAFYFWLPDVFMKFIITCLAIVVLAGCAGHQQPQTKIQPKPVPAPSSDLRSIETNFIMVYVTGEVLYPGRITWRPGLTLTKAISLAGGFTDFADTQRLEIRSLDGVVEEYNYYSAMSAATNNPSLKRGDTVNVGRRFF
jgi:SLBB domain